jgi:hypothetical protein
MRIWILTVVIRYQGNISVADCAAVQNTSAQHVGLHMSFRCLPVCLSICLSACATIPRRSPSATQYTCWAASQTQLQRRLQRATQQQTQLPWHQSRWCWMLLWHTIPTHRALHSWHACPNPGECCS